MTEEKQKKVDAIIDKQQSMGMTVVKAIVICLIVVLLLVGGFIAFLQLSLFEAAQGKTSADVFKAEAVADLNYGDEGITLAIPEDVISYMVEGYVRGQLDDTKADLKSLYYDGFDQRIYMNLSYKGFYLPISRRIDFKQLNNNITMTYSDLRFSQYGWSFGAKISEIVRGYIGMSETSQTIDLYQVGLNPHLRLTDMTFVDDNMVLILEAETARIEDEVVKIRKAIDPVLLEHYKTFEPDRTAPVLDFLEKQFPLTDQQTQALINDMLGKQFIISDMLLLTDGYDLTGFNQLMEDYNLVLDTPKIDMERKAFKGQAMDPQIAKIFVALDRHFSEKIMAFNQGEPFDIEEMTTMTIKELINRYKVLIDEDLAKDMTFVYEDAFKIAYKLDGETYYIRGIDGYEVVDVETYKKMLGSTAFVKPTYVQDRELWDGVVTFATGYFDVTDVFVRYMKSDGRSVFAIVSTYDDPQDYWSMALFKKDSEFDVLEENVTSIPALISNHPEFNVETATLEVEEVSFERIGPDIHELILDELYNQNIIASRRNTSIIYSSYDGKKYIAFKLSDGDEFVYKVEGTVYGTYLTTVYTKGKAKKNWSDMSEMLLLQDPPQ